MSTVTYLITGASRGLGYEYTKKLLSSSDNVRVIAAARKPDSAKQLHALKEKYGDRIYTVKLDVNDESTIKAAASELENSSFLKEGGLDVLVNNAGIVTGGFKAATESSISDLQTDFNTNVIGVINTTIAFLPLLKKGNKKQIFVVSSILGSLGHEYNRMPMAAMYSVSKAAINMYFMKLSTELKEQGFTVVPFHPGYVKTDMNGGSSGSAEIEPEEAGKMGVENVLLKVTPADNGKFYSYTGEVLPW